MSARAKSKRKAAPVPTSEQSQARRPLPKALDEHLREQQYRCRQLSQLLHLVADSACGDAGPVIEIAEHIVDGVAAELDVVVLEKVASRRRPPGEMQS